MSFLIPKLQKCSRYYNSDNKRLNICSVTRNQQLLSLDLQNVCVESQVRERMDTLSQTISLTAASSLHAFLQSHQLSHVQV
jgi:hypothetical protein